MTEQLDRTPVPRFGSFQAVQDWALSHVKSDDQLHNALAARQARLERYLLGALIGIAATFGGVVLQLLGVGK